MVLAAWLARVFMGWLLPQSYFMSLGIAQGFWTIAFVLFVFSYAKILLSERQDKLFG